jgi:hypothetical protein
MPPHIKLVGWGMGMGGRWYHSPMLLRSGDVKLIFWVRYVKKKGTFTYVDYEAFKQ